MSARSFLCTRAIPPAIIAALLFLLGGCNISFEQDPAETVTVEISGISAEADRDEIKETLSGMTDGSGHMITSVWSGDTMTVNLSPVADVWATDAMKLHGRRDLKLESDSMSMF